MTRPAEIPVGAGVFDRWWPHRLGIVTRQSKTRTHVAWSDGEVWRYDAAHRQFLEALGRSAERGLSNKRRAKRT